MSKSTESLKFSILIPSYNGAVVISQAIDSILAQEYHNYEIIVNDDASSDATETVVKSYKDKRIQFFKNKKNLGYPGNLNKCRDHASGDIIYLLGQDDVLAKDALLRTYQAFLLSPDIGAVTRPYRQFDERLDVTIRARFPLNPHKDEVVKITDDYKKIVEVFKSLDSLSALGYRAKFMDRPFHPDIFPCHVYPFASIFKNHPVVYLKDYVSSVSMRHSQCWHVSSIYDVSPVMSWARMFETIFVEKKFKKLRTYCIQNFVAINYVGLSQIKNYSRHSLWYTVREIGYLIKYRPKNLISPLFWLFSLGALLTPRFILIPVVDWYKKKVNGSLLKFVSFKSPFTISPKKPMNRHCNMCQSTDVKKIFVSQNIHGRFLLTKKDKFDVYKCNDCNNIFLGNLIINDAYYTKYYEGNYYTVDLGNDILNFIIKMMDVFSYRMKERMILSQSQTKKKLDILDVGCGIGVFLQQLNREKFNKYGVEINAKGADEARKKGITVYTSDFLKLEQDKKFDVITMWHVLEHMPDPQAVIKKISSMLRKNGLLVFAVPNSDSLGFIYGKKYWYHLDSPRHLFIPNRSNLKQVMTDNHLILVKTVYEFYDYPIDLLVSVKKSRIKYLVYPLYPLFKFLSPETLTYIVKNK